MSDGAPHSIHLRGPWEFALVDGLRAGETGRLNFSGDWRQQLPADANTLRLTRFFQTPTGIDAHTRVTLVVSDFPPQSIVCLDSEPLASASPHRYEIAARLRGRHRLELEISAHELVTSGEVWLEIRAV